MYATCGGMLHRYHGQYCHTVHHWPGHFLVRLPTSVSVTNSHLFISPQCIIQYIINCTPNPPLPGPWKRTQKRTSHGRTQKTKWLSRASALPKRTRASQRRSPRDRGFWWAIDDAGPGYDFTRVSVIERPLPRLQASAVNAVSGLPTSHAVCVCTVPTSVGTAPSGPESSLRLLVSDLLCHCLLRRLFVL